MFERIRHRVTTIHADRQTLVAEAGTTAMGRYRHLQFVKAAADRHASLDPGSQRHKFRRRSDPGGAAVTQFATTE